MSYSPPNYTDGVPVKISEKYKPAPEITLTAKLLQQLSKSKIPVAFEDDYNFDLERKIISKTAEWKNYRWKEKTERQQRIQQREIERKKKIEHEQKEKLNQVSYPSADELTSSEDENQEHEEAKHSTRIIPNDEKPFSPNFNSNTILMPTQAELFQQPDASKKSHRRYASNSSNKIDFSFFESDTSPFDHLEMKSMNEMEVLAQVLKSTTTIESDENSLVRNNSSESESSDHTKNNNNNIENTQQQSAIEHPDIETAPALPVQYHYYNNPQVYENYYGTQGNNQSSLYQTAGQLTTTATPYHNLNLPSNAYYTQNYAVNHMNYVMGNNNNVTCENSDKMDAASKSKSVPDIVKELNDELNNSERRRIRNYSQNSHKDVTPTTETKNTTSNEEEFSKLGKNKELAKQFCQMGFEEKLVNRVLMRIGDNDKKIVEHLISLSELLQMGFEEESVSEALIKFDNNKDQALDYLIS